MAKEFRIGVAGLTHGHVWGLIDAASKVEGVRLVGVADTTPLLEKATGFEASFTNWREMLDKAAPDALIVTSDNRESAQIAIEALGRGIPCLVEKAMAADAADADRMLEAAKLSGKCLMINWPLEWNPWVHELKRQIEADRIGHVFHFRFRNGHSGPKEIGCDQWFVGWLYDEQKNGGGAIADFGSYGAVLARWLFGMPEGVYCIRHNTTKNYEISDDHAVLLLKYPRRDVFLEGTWATKAWENGPNPVAYGKEGTLAVYGGTLRLHEPSGVSDVEAPALPISNPVAYFMRCIQEGRQPEGILDPAISADGVRITDAAIRSSASGCAEKP